ncbi:type I methionyl aminopeptidase [Candidatus Saccharibacteria bacterium]|nr:type I methionyl aminopeptidase [Candidatus Saccharibacteria bacterium]
MVTRVKTEQEIADITVSGRMLATVLDELEKYVEPGISTKELAMIAASELKKLGGKPAFLGFGGFPDVICISRNAQVVHGLPNDDVVEDGDLLSLDFGVDYNGMKTDAARTLIVGGKGSGEKRKLLKGTKEALDAGINTLHDGVRVGDIGAAVEKVMVRYGFGIVRDLVGHGVGHEVHEDPQIPNYGIAGTGEALKAGMTICIEPMSTLGGDDVVLEKDGWTISTKDGSLSAHFEHTILITKDSAEILT